MAEKGREVSTTGSVATEDGVDMATLRESQVERAIRDSIFVAVLTFGFMVFCSFFDVFEAVFLWSRRYEVFEVDEFLPLIVVFSLCFSWYSWRRLKDAVRIVSICKKTEDALRESEKRYRKVFENIQDAYCETKIDGTILEVSPAITAFSGYDRTDMVGRRIYDYYADPARKADLFNALLIHGNVQNFEVEMRVQSGRIRSGSMNCILERDESGRPFRIYGTMRDVTDSKRTARALAESERKYRGIFENIQDVYYELAVDGIILEISPAIERSFLFRRDELIGSSFYDCCADPSIKDVFFNRVLEEVRVQDYEIQLRERDGRLRDVSVNCELIRDMDDAPVKIIGSIRDISDRKRAEEALRRSRDDLERRVAERTTELVLANDRLTREIEDRKRVESELLMREETVRALTENSTDIIMRLDRKMTLVFVNAAAERMTGIPPRELTGRTPQDIGFSERFCRMLADAVLPVFENGTAQDLEFGYEGVDGYRTYDWRLIPEWSPEGSVETVLSTARDISRLKEAERRIQNLTQELIRAQESERQKIARDLHDHIAQDLATLKILSQTLFDGLEHVPDLLCTRAETLTRTLGGSIQAVRDLAYDLRPPTLDALGLARTVFLYCDDFAEKHSIQVDFSSAGMDALLLDFDTEINLYRLLQEALNNVKKHALAKEVTVRLVASYPHIILRIEDDGAGFNVKDRIGAALAEKRMGLRSMEERVGLLGGKMKIQSTMGQGTRIYIEVPISRSSGDGGTR